MPTATQSAAGAVAERLHRSALRTRELFCLTFDVPFDVTPLDCLYIFALSWVVRYIGNSYARKLFIVATVGARRVRELEQTKQLLAMELETERGRAQFARTRQVDDDLGALPQLQRTLSF